MLTLSYRQRRSQIEAYFDRTAADAWSRLTSDVPLGRIRSTVRAGREQMRQILLDWLPADLNGKRLLDAGSGTGSLSIEAARRGAHVVAVDLSPTLIDLARERTPEALRDQLTFLVGDMLDPALGVFDHVVAMDSLIHYQSQDAVAVIMGLAARTRSSLVFTFAPRTPALALMHAVGRWFPRSDRAPAIEPVRVDIMRDLLMAQPELVGWKPARTQRVVSGFYTSQALELARP